jgi:hypothetical protein
MITRRSLAGVKPQVSATRTSREVAKGTPLQVIRSSGRGLCCTTAQRKSSLRHRDGWATIRLEVSDYCEAEDRNQSS